MSEKLVDKHKLPQNQSKIQMPPVQPPKPERSGLAYEIEKLETKLNKKYAKLDKIQKAMDLKLAQLETLMTKLGSWVAKKQEQETQAGLEQKPQLSQVDQSGETWLKHQAFSHCVVCGHQLVRSYGLTTFGFMVCPREVCSAYGLIPK